MSSKEAKPVPERAHTDASLRAERRKADALLLARTAAVEHTADAVVELERQEADNLIEAAREQADAVIARAEDAPAIDEAEVAVARATEDEALASARAEADALLERGRAAQKTAIKHLLAVEREETNERLDDERERADTVVASRDDFLAMVSHDVRGLLTGMSMSADLLLETTPELVAERLPREARRIQRLTARMNRLIGDLLDVVSMESGKLKVIAMPQDARPLVADTMEAFQLLAKQRTVDLTAEVPSTPIAGVFDHDRILQVLTNLVGNAIKFTEPGGRVTVTLAPIDDGIQFTVRDNGCGIAADQLESIFERFSQAAQADRRGLGLGLYIARGIVEAHRGTLSVTSELGHGCAFYVTLPAAA